MISAVCERLTLYRCLVPGLFVLVNEASHEPWLCSCTYIGRIPIYSSVKIVVTGCASSVPRVLSSRPVGSLPFSHTTVPRLQRSTGKGDGRQRGRCLVGFYGAGAALISSGATAVNVRPHQSRLKLGRGLAVLGA